MRALETLFKKKKKLVIGLMSGTSADGVDAVVIEITGAGVSTRIRQLAFETYPYPRGYKDFLLENSHVQSARLDDVTRLHILVAEFFSDAVCKIVKKAKKRMTDIDLIGSHGQTIHHLPIPKHMFGKNIRATLQIGSPSAIAKRTGIVTVGDFRIGDVAVGGSGAPLVPLFDYVMLRSRTVNRIALNIGGIANMTVLPRNCSIDDVVAFDTGPGNMVIDACMVHLYGKPFDRNGKVALKGKILPSLLHWMLQHDYFTVKPPKSTGRETFGKEYLRQILRYGRRARNEDIVATVTEFTALGIYQQYMQYVRKTMITDELLVSGGGSKNTYLMEALSNYFSNATVLKTDTIHLSSDAKEAICFALLANETISGNPGNVPGATGAWRRTVLGSICLP